MIVIKSIVSLLFLLFLSTSSGDAANRVIEIYPSNADGTCNEEFENVVNTLLPGDRLALHGRGENRSTVSASPSSPPPS